MPGPASGVTAGASAPSETLRDLYERYCREEALGLIQILPRSGLRELWARAAERRDPGGNDDSVARLERECRELLPLPPYEVWLDAYLADRRPFLERLGVPTAPRRTEPVTVAVRPMTRGRWVHLGLFVRGSVWRGYLSFHGAHPTRTYRTADIFRADAPEEIRAAFEELSRSSLEAFLRSAGG